MFARPLAACPWVLPGYTNTVSPQGCADQRLGHRRGDSHLRFNRIEGDLGNRAVNSGVILSNFDVGIKSFWGSKNTVENPFFGLPERIIQ